MPLIDPLRESIRDALAGGVSLNELGRRCGVSAGQLSRFLRGERSLTLTAAEKLVDHLGLKLVGAGRRRPS